MSGKAAPDKPARKCPECGRPAAADAFPFCSARCKDVDLHRWLTGAYVIPGEPDDEAPDPGAVDSGSEER